MIEITLSTSLDTK